jgi:hypothetical protein
VNGGYRITGRGPLASNIHDAEWLFLTAFVIDGSQPKMNNGMPEVRGFMLRANEAQIIDTWHSLGMRGTDSNDVVVENVFVPTSRTFALVPEFEPSSHYRGRCIGATIAKRRGLSTLCATALPRHDGGGVGASPRR